MNRCIIVWASLTLIAACAQAGIKAHATPAEPIYDPDPSHLWNRLHQAFFVRTDAPAGSNSDTVDPPLWQNTSDFLRGGPSYQNAIAVLDEFLSEKGETLFRKPVKRAILQQDLWSVFDWAAQNQTEEQSLSKLRGKLAEAMIRLALNKKEIRSLPNNFAFAAAGQSFAPDWDPEHPQLNFLPPDLLQGEGPWVCVRGAMDGPSAPVHARYYGHRSPFSVFIRLPGGRPATSKFLKELNQASRKSLQGKAEDLPLFPVGTAVALLRHMSVIDTSGRIQVTPLVQTLQMRVYRQVSCAEVKDHKNSQSAVKFRLQRKALFAWRDGGLVPVSKEEPLVRSLLNRQDIYERDKGHGGIGTVMQSCIACHSCGGANIHSVFTYKQDDWVPGAQDFAPNRLRLTATTLEKEQERIVQSKMKRYDWGLLKGLLDTGPVARH